VCPLPICAAPLTLFDCFGSLKFWEFISNLFGAFSHEYKNDFMVIRIAEKRIKQILAKAFEPVNLGIL
jgi:hypothetical protein